MTSAIIVAAGSGKRMGGLLPKQFIEINGKLILEHTLNKFVHSKIIDEIVIVLSPDYLEIGKELMTLYPAIRMVVCEGGKERFHSVKNALDIVSKNCDIVFIHDAVRPFCSLELIQRCYTECAKHTSAIPSISLKDSIRALKENGQTEIVDRTNLRSIQTPQVFDFKKLYLAYQVEFKEAFTDDATVYESAGYPIHLVDGESINLKITTPKDIEFARHRL